MVIHSQTININSGSYVTVGAEVILVKRPSDLAPALRQHQNPVVIDNEEINARFRRLSYWENKRQIFLVGWIAALVVLFFAYAISQQYGIDAGWKGNGTKLNLREK